MPKREGFADGIDWEPMSRKTETIVSDGFREAEDSGSSLPATVKETETRETRPTDLTVRSANVTGRDVRLGNLLTVDEVKVSGEDIQILTGPDGRVHIGGITATITITESALNRFLQGRIEDQLNHLQVRMLNGKVRIEGRYRLFPFTFTAVPEIEGGARLRLDPRQMSLVGLPLPGMGAQMIGEKINSRLSTAFDITRFNLPLRLTNLTIETGRMLLSAAGEIEIAPTRQV